MKTNEENSEFIIGRHPAMAALKSDQEIKGVHPKGIKDRRYCSAGEVG